MPVAMFFQTRETPTLVEWRRIRSVHPRVLQHDWRRPVFDNGWKIAPVKEGFIKGNFEHVAEPRVDIDPP